MTTFKNLFFTFIFQGLAISSAVIGSEIVVGKVDKYPTLVMSKENDKHRIGIYRNYAFDGIARITDLKTGKEWVRDVSLVRHNVVTHNTQLGIFSPDKSKFVFAQYFPAPSGFDKRQAGLVIEEFDLLKQKRSMDLKYGYCLDDIQFSPETNELLMIKD